MFSWDPQKALLNFFKHRISFEEAVSVFSDHEALDWNDSIHSALEVRSKRLGESILGNILLVVYTVRSTDDGKETIRIISARPASRKERKAYQR